MKILITGASGFLAGSLLGLLKEKYPNSKIVGLVSSESDYNSEEYAEIYKDMGSLRSAESEFDQIYHLASFIPYGQLDTPDSRFVSTNIGLTLEISQAYPEAKLIYSSSVAVYGSPDALPIKTGSPFVNPTLYGQSKLAGESVVDGHKKYAIIRFTSIIGAGMQEHSFIPTSIHKATNQGKIPINGDGTRLQNYINVKDAARLCLTCAEMEENLILLGVDNRSYSNLEVAQLISEHTGAEIIFEGHDDSPSFTYDVEDIYDELSYSTEYDMNNSIELMLKS